MSVRHERDYLERTIATVRNHRGAENCWPQWANIFADEIERCWAALDELEAQQGAHESRATQDVALRGGTRTPPEGRSDEGGDGWDSRAPGFSAGAEATSESVVPSSSEPSPATRQQEADSGDPGSAATGPSPAEAEPLPGRAHLIEQLRAAADGFTDDPGGIFDPFAKLLTEAADALAAAERNLVWERDEHDKARTEWLLMRDRLNGLRAGVLGAVEHTEPPVDYDEPWCPYGGEKEIEAAPWSWLASLVRECVAYYEAFDEETWEIEAQLRREAREQLEAERDRLAAELAQAREALDAAKEVVGYARAYRKLGEDAAPELDWALSEYDALAAVLRCEGQPESRASGSAGDGS